MKVEFCSHFTYESKMGWFFSWFSFFFTCQEGVPTFKLLTCRTGNWKFPMKSFGLSIGIRRRRETQHLHLVFISYWSIFSKYRSYRCLWWKPHLLRLVSGGNVSFSPVCTLVSLSERVYWNWLKRLVFMHTLPGGEELVADTDANFSIRLVHCHLAEIRVLKESQSSYIWDLKKQGHSSLRKATGKMPQGINWDHLRSSATWVIWHDRRNKATTHDVIATRLPGPSMV